MNASNESSAAALSARASSRFTVSQEGLACERKCDLSMVCIVCGGRAVHAQHRKVSFGPRMNPAVMMTGPLIWLVWGIYAYLKTHRSELTLGYCDKHFRARSWALAGTAVTGAAIVGLLLSVGRTEGSVAAASLAVTFMGLMVAVGYVTSEFAVAGVDKAGTVTLKGVEPSALQALARSQVNTQPG